MKSMTYYKIMVYLVANGLSKGKADYVRGMIRKLVDEKGGKINHRVSQPDWEI